MSSQTAKYLVPYPQLADTVASLAATCQNLASRMDLLLGESGTFTASPAAGTTLNKAIVLSRTYPGNALFGISGVGPSGFVHLWTTATYGSAVTFNWWPNTWTGTATTVTGFTLSMQWSVAQTGREFGWRFIPVL